jgi:hypothetical protein
MGAHTRDLIARTPLFAMILLNGGFTAGRPLTNASMGVILSPPYLLCFFDKPTRVKPLEVVAERSH